MASQAFEVLELSIEQHEKSLALPSCLLHRPGVLCTLRTSGYPEVISHFTSQLIWVSFNKLESVSPVEALGVMQKRLERNWLVDFISSQCEAA